MKKLKIILCIIALIPCILLTGCKSIEVNGKTFVYNKVTIDWGLAQSKEEKQEVLNKFEVTDKSEFIKYLETYQDRKNRVTTFGVDNKYYTKNSNNEIVDEGYYRQDESVITLADSEEGLDENGTFTLQANEKGYIVIVKLDDTNKVFARYEYHEQT